MKTWVLLFLLFTVAQGDESADPEHPRITSSSQEFVMGTTTALNLIQKSNFEEGLETPSLAASSAEDFQKLVNEINAKSPIPGVGIGDAKIEYDVILQPGHYLRTSGRTGTHGKYVTEQALVAFVTNIVAATLRRTGESVLVVSADNYLHAVRSGSTFTGLHSKVFLAMHADGNDHHPCTIGPSLGYQKPTSAIAMNFVAIGLADALGYNYTDFRRNFTANEADYYMFREIRAQRLTGLLEVGELTCEPSEKALISSSHAVGANIARAIDFMLRSAQTTGLNPQATFAHNVFVFAGPTETLERITKPGQR